MLSANMIAARRGLFRASISAVPALRSTARAYGLRGFSSEVPINQVARVVRLEFKEPGEASALQMDTMKDDFLSKVKETPVPGLVKVERLLCKGEWVYEVHFVFDSLDNFKAYMDSDFKANVASKMFADATKLAKDGSIYEGVRVFDEYKI